MRGVSRYFCFGLREEWVTMFITHGATWISNNSLGPFQQKSFRYWMIDAGILKDKNNDFTELGHLLMILYPQNPLWGWCIFWCNIYYSWQVANWYLTNNHWQVCLSVKELHKLLHKSFTTLSLRTVSNSINALVNTFAESPLGYQLKLGLVEQQGRMRYIHKLGTDDIHHLVVAYTLYKFKDVTGRNDIFVDELYEKNCNGGPYKLFGISQDALKSKLIELHNTKILDINNMGNPSRIFLKESYTSIDMVRLFML